MPPDARKRRVTAEMREAKAFPQDESLCAKCKHVAKEHANLVERKSRPGWRRVRGKNTYGKCSYAHGIHAHFCWCGKFEFLFAEDKKCLK
jgi:hypothetical protein